jgi:hypothetical protein
MAGDMALLVPWVRHFKAAPISASRSLPLGHCFAPSRAMRRAVLANGPGDFVARKPDIS